MNISQTFANRREAGKMLARKLLAYKGRNDVVVLGLPRGGVPVAYEVAKMLGLPLDILTVRKLGMPGHEEYAFGSIASGGIRFINEDVVRATGLSQWMIEQVIEREQRELDRREKAYRGDRPAPELLNKTVIIVDDGLATGSTMRAAVVAVRAKHPAEIVVAAPVCARETCDQLDRAIDTWCVCVLAPEPFHAVGLWYQDFTPTSDDEVQFLLKASVENAAKAQKI